MFILLFKCDVRTSISQRSPGRRRALHGFSRVGPIGEGICRSDTRYTPFTHRAYVGTQTRTTFGPTGLGACFPLLIDLYCNVLGRMEYLSDVTDVSFNTPVGELNSVRREIAEEGVDPPDKPLISHSPLRLVF